ncbi:hypothetical protein Agabi119p4_11475 [Agaricus bisporus var. burnettii]|uniref:Blue (type 1) copper domain-containing protein n=1 Tax=Agaricus bisporus var. burnettii TaxID=192524 RepID=A0A8H7C0A2_AGABI|nr:hypothetical protein Agabi119p4_11475 [Agaricus bisporus var. burnettii]
MRFATVLAPLLLTGLAVAQNNSTNSSDVVTVMVGGTIDTPNGGIFQFIPNNVKASNGTVVRFMFTGMPGNHSITQSSFSAPCTDLEGGFDSGWVSIPNEGVQPAPEWNLTVTNDQRPLWFFCKQLIPSPHCIAGMVGAINAADDGDNSFDNYKQAASQVSPTEVDQTQNGLVGQGASASQRPSPIPSGANLFPDASAPAGSGSGSGSGTGTGTGDAPTTTSPSGATNILATMNSGLIALVAGVSVMFLA